jgi:aminoglycoside phosphotransferase (APT) family kinase protein
VRVQNHAPLAGGASQETWQLDLDVAAGEAQGEYQLVLRRQLGGKIYPGALDLWQEFRVMQVAYAADVLVPYPQAYLPDVLGRPAALLHRKHGETIGRRILREPGLETARRKLPAHMGEMLARIHRIAFDRFGLNTLLPLAPISRAERRHDPQDTKAGAVRAATPARWVIEQLEANLDEIGEPHPALELGLRWLRRHEPAPPPQLSLVHGDYRIGNVMVNAKGLVSVLDWEFAHIGDSYEDLAWPQLRDWRFGNDQLRFGGIAAPDEFYAAYERTLGTTVDRQRVDYWEVMGNLRWAVGMLNQARRHLSGQEPNLEFASLGRRCAEIELEVLQLIDG